MTELLLFINVGVIFFCGAIIAYLRHQKRQLKRNLRALSLKNERLQEALHAVNQRTKIEQAVHQLDDHAVADVLQSDYRD